MTPSPAACPGGSTTQTLRPARVRPSAHHCGSRRRHQPRPFSDLRASCRVRATTLYERLGAMIANGTIVKSADGYHLAALNGERQAPNPRGGRAKADLNIATTETRSHPRHLDHFPLPVPKHPTANGKRNWEAHQMPRSQAHRKALILPTNLVWRAYVGSQPLMRCHWRAVRLTHARAVAPFRNQLE